MSHLLSFFTALALSVAIIPLMIRLAPRLGMVDMPDPRKVHSAPIPRVGGIGIVMGALVPLFLWLPLDEGTRAYLFGSLVLLVFGTWDDTKELGHYVKFIGQFLAVIPLVYYGDVWVSQLPLFDTYPLPESIGKPFTVFALVGMINAINHSDGLDGLAGGLSVLSLSCIAWFAWLAGGTHVITIVAAVLGGILGFLRYNSHPARVFMGDGGSQFIGYTLGFLAVVLTQQVNPALSPALPALILGLPIVDILAVFVQRVYGGMNWFRASKNHVHHRLLELGFDHYEAVVIIYSIQMLFIVSALFLSYESDLLILSLYLAVCALVFALLVGAKRRGWRAHKPDATSRLARFVAAAKRHPLLIRGPALLIAIALPALLIAVSLLADRVPRDFGISAALLAVLLLGYLLLVGNRGPAMLRAAVYVTAAFIVYLETRHLSVGVSWFAAMEAGFFLALALAVMVSVRVSGPAQFSTTPTDYLIILVVVAAGIMVHSTAGLAHLGPMAAKLVVLFYACELLLTKMKNRWNFLTTSTLGSLVVMGFRGLV